MAINGARKWFCLALITTILASCTKADPETSVRSSFTVSDTDAGTCEFIELDASSGYKFTDRNSGASVLIPAGAFVSDSAVKFCLTYYGSEPEMPGYNADAGVVLGTDNAGGRWPLVTLGAASVWASAALAPGVNLTLTLPVPPGQQCLMRYALNLGLLGIWAFDPSRQVWVRLNDANATFSSCGTVVSLSSLGIYNCDFPRIYLDEPIPCDDAGTDGSSCGEAGTDAGGQ